MEQGLSHGNPPSIRTRRRRGSRGPWTFTEPLSERFTGSGGVACYGASGTVALVEHGLSNYASGTGMPKTVMAAYAVVLTASGSAGEDP